MRDTETQSVQYGFLLLDPKKEKKNYKGWQESFIATALFVVPAQINVLRFWSSVVILPPFSRWVPRRSIDRFPRIIDSTRITSRRTSAELVNGSSQFPSHEIIIHSIYPFVSKTTSSSWITLFNRRRFFFFSFLSSFHFSFCCCCGCCVILTLALTLALNFAYCCRRWRSLKTITRFVLLHWVRDGDGSTMPSCSQFPPRILICAFSLFF